MNTETSVHFKKQRNTSVQRYMQIDHLPLTRDHWVNDSFIAGTWVLNPVCGESQSTYREQNDEADNLLGGLDGFSPYNDI